MNQRYFSRAMVYAGGIFLMSLGSNLSVLSGLGVSPINSVPYAVSTISGISLGNCAILVYSFYVLVQFALKRAFTPRDLLQIVAATLFGKFVNLTFPLVAFLRPEHYLTRLLFLLCSIGLVALGVCLYMQAQLINLPAEGLTAVLADQFPRIPFHTLKIMVDCSFVLIAAALGFVFLGRVEGMREGTLLAAVLVGRLIPKIRQQLVRIQAAFAPKQKRPEIGLGQEQA